MLKYTVLHGDKKISIKAAAEVVKMSEPAVRNYVVKHNCKTIEDIEKRKSAPGRRGGNYFKKVNTSKGKLTVPEIAALHEHKEVSVISIRGRIARRGSECPSLWYPKMSGWDFRKKLVEDGLEPPMDHMSSSTKNGLVSIKRKTCVVDGILCKHYSECTDKICFDRELPAKYKEDKSCYEK